MKHKGFRRLAAILAASLLLTGCGSIMLNANLDKAKVKDYVPRDENGNSYYSGDSDAAVPEALGTKLMLRADREKYQIGGTDAFYLLPSGVPVPEGLISFKVLDLIDEKTTVYAYQSIYQNDDKNGLGGLPESGTAQEYEEVLSADNMNQMVTILMTYNTETREYHVLFHQVDDVDVKIRPYEDEEMSMRDQLVITKDGRDIKEVGSCFSQKLVNGRYMIYYDGISRVYDKNGTLEYTFNVVENLKLHHYLNQTMLGRDKDTNFLLYGYPDFTITNVVMDSNYFLYVLMTVEKPNQEVSKDMDEDDLENQGDENGSGGSAVNQQLITFFSLDLSSVQKESSQSVSSAFGSGSFTEDESKYFVSENQVFEEKKEAWEKSVYREGVEQKTLLVQEGNETVKKSIPIYDIGELDSEDDFPSKEELVKIAASRCQIPTAEELGLSTGVFGPYEFRSKASGLDVQLYLSTWDNTDIIEEILDDVGHSHLSHWGHVVARKLKGLTPDLLEENTEDYENFLFTKRILGKFPDQVSGDTTYSGRLLILPRTLYRLPQNEILTSVTRRYIVRYYRPVSEEEVEGSDGYELMDVPITERYYLTKEYRLKLGNANAQWTDDRVTSDMIAPSAGTGIVRYNTSKTNDYEDGAWAVWQLSEDLTGIDKQMTPVPGKAKNCMLFMDHNNPVIALLTDKETVFFTNFASQNDGAYRPDFNGQKITEIPNNKLYFGLTMESDLLDTMVQIRNNPDYDLGDGEEVTYSATDLLGVMLESGMRFTNSYVYMASAASGLVKVNLADGMEQRGGQVSPYPYFGVWLNDAETAADTIGFQSSEYEYNNEDISRAKLYKVSLFDQDATVNLVLTALEKDSELSKKILNGDDAEWKKLISELGLNRKEADVGQINRYYEFLKSGQKAQDNAVVEFYELAGVKESSRTEELKDRILECQYKTQLEELMCELRPDILLENGEQPIEETTKAETAKEETSADSSEKSKSKIPDITEIKKDSSLDSQTVQEAGERQEKYRSRQGKISLVTSYLQEKAGKTQDEWDAQLANLVEALHPSNSLAEYEKKMALKDFAALLGYKVQSGMEEKIKACTSVEELEEAMAWYYLPSTTRAILQEDADARKKAADASQETTEETKSGYSTGSKLNVDIFVPGSKTDTGDGETKRQMTAEELKEYYKTQKEENERKLKEAKQDLEEAFEKYCKPSIVKNAEIVTGAGTVKQADQSGFGKKWNAKWDTWLAEKLLNIQKILKTE